MKREIVTFGCFLLMALLVGCVSLEKTQMRLQSSDAKEVQKAKDTIYSIAAQGRDPLGLLQFDTQDRIKYVQLANDNELLFKILADSDYAYDVRAAVIEKLDFSKARPEDNLTLFNVLKPSEENVSAEAAIQKFNFSSPGSAYKFIAAFEKSAENSQMRTRQSLCNLQGKLYKLLIAHLTETEMVKVLVGEYDWYFQHDTAEALMDKVKNAKILVSMYNGKLKKYFNTDVSRKKIVIKLAQCANQIVSKDLVKELLSAGTFSEKFVRDDLLRKQLLERLPLEERVDFVVSSLKNFEKHHWTNHEMSLMNDAITTFSMAADKTLRVKVVSAILTKISKIEDACRNGFGFFVSWDRDDEKVVNEIIKKLGPLTDDELLSLVHEKNPGWCYVQDLITPAAAYEMVVSGKALSDEMERELVKKIPVEKWDLALYQAVSFQGSRKEIYPHLTEEMKKQVYDDLQSAFISISMKSFEAAKTTFAMKGFYIGMSMKEVEKLLEFFCQDMEYYERREGEGKNERLVIRIAGQKTPFCYVSLKDNKVYAFNFGRKVLHNMFLSLSNAQTMEDYVAVLNKELKVDFRSQTIMQGTTVYENDLSGSYDVKHKQNAYVYKNNALNYKLTYFGKGEFITFASGLSARVLKESAAENLRNIIGDEGSLRVVLSYD